MPRTYAIELAKVILRSENGPITEDMRKAAVEYLKTAVNEERAFVEDLMPGLTITLQLPNRLTP